MICMHLYILDLEVIYSILDLELELRTELCALDLEWTVCVSVN